MVFDFRPEQPQASGPGPAGARFSKAPETFQARKAIFSSSVSKKEEVYTPQWNFLYEENFSSYWKSVNKVAL